MSEAPAFKSGFVAMIGRSNAGKSTLTNALVGEKVAIVSDTPQTTRHRLRAIYDGDGVQMVIVDTPGLHKPIDALGEELNTSALKALEDVDVVAFLVDASKPVGRGDEWVAQHVAQAKASKILVITKADLATQEQVQEQIQAASSFADWDDVVVVSAQEGFNLQGFVSAVTALLPEGPRWFPEDMGTDQSLDVLIAEFIREKVLFLTHDEVPHAVGVQVTDLDYDKGRDLYSIYAYIYVERDSQKGILIGKGGEMVKAIGTAAREDLCRLLGGRVHLDLKVKVRKAWRKDATQVRRFGYGEGL